MANATVANQKAILKNQTAILANQKAILANQGKLDRVLANQKKIQANQARILANQKKILSRWLSAPRQAQRPVCPRNFPASEPFLWAPGRAGPIGPNLDPS